MTDTERDAQHGEAGVDPPSGSVAEPIDSPPNFSQVVEESPMWAELYRRFWEFKVARRKRQETYEPYPVCSCVACYESEKVK